jgi:uncharacterized protein YlxW (UPF0749 family)
MLLLFDCFITPSRLDVPRSLVVVTSGSHASPSGEAGARPYGRLRGLLVGDGGRGWSAWRVGTPIVVLLCGGLFVVSAVNSHGTDLRPGRYTDLASLAGSERGDYQKLESQVSDLQKQVTDLTNAVPDATVRKARDEADALKLPAGLTAVTGEGVSITLSDAPRELIDKTTGDPNRMVVHQQDIQAVVNALWAGGAEAVTIQGQRVVTTTGIKCSGSTVLLQGVPYPEPFVIQAVGNQSALLSAIDESHYLKVYQSDAADPTIDVGWSLDTEDEVKAPAYKGLLDLTYAKPLPTS